MDTVIEKLKSICDGGTIEAQIFNNEQKFNRRRPLNFAVSPHYCNALAVVFIYF